MRAGGKGLNVARLLRALGHEVTALGLADARFGASAGLPNAFARRSPGDPPHRRGRGRRGHDAERARPGDLAGEWAAFLADFRAWLPRASAVVMSGSLPPGLPPDAYAVLARLAGDVPTIVDAEGDALVHALAARPHVVKPNADELGPHLRRGDVRPRRRDAAAGTRRAGRRRLRRARGLHADTPRACGGRCRRSPRRQPDRRGGTPPSRPSPWAWSPGGTGPRRSSTPPPCRPPPSVALAGQADHAAYRANLTVVTTEPLSESADPRRRDHLRRPRRRTGCGRVQRDPGRARPGHRGGRRAGGPAGDPADRREHRRLPRRPGRHRGRLPGDRPRGARCRSRCTSTTPPGATSSTRRWRSGSAR